MCIICIECESIERVDFCISEIARFLQTSLKYGLLSGITPHPTHPALVWCSMNNTNLETDTGVNAEGEKKQSIQAAREF